MAYDSYTPNLVAQTATYVDRILKGAKPADLPVQQPTKFDFVINLKTTKAIGLTSRSRCSSRRPRSSSSACVTNAASSSVRRSGSRDARCRPTIVRSGRCAPGWIPGRGSGGSRSAWRYDEKGWRVAFYTSGMEHSPTSATGTGRQCCAR